MTAQEFSKEFKLTVDASGVGVGEEFKLTVDVSGVGVGEEFKLTVDASGVGVGEEFKLTVDASGVGVGGVLHQEGKDNIDLPTYYFSKKKKLDKHQKNNSTIEKVSWLIVIFETF